MNFVLVLSVSYVVDVIASVTHCLHRLSATTATHFFEIVYLIVKNGMNNKGEKYTIIVLMMLLKIT